MTDGDLLLDRYRLQEAVPGPDAVHQWRALDELTNREVELLILTTGRTTTDRLESFGAVHEVLERLDEVPHLARTHDVHRDGDRIIAVRQPLSGRTLADVRGPLPWSEVEAIGAALGASVLAAGPALRGALLPADVALDQVGRPILAPRGAPLTRVVKGTTKAVAPEVLQSGARDGPAGLYGLGVILYRLATGREPATSVNGAPPVAPSTHRPGIPPSLDEAILGLLSHQPGTRTAALARLSSGPPPDLSEHASRPTTEDVRTTVATTSTPRGAAEAPAAWVVVRPEQLVDLAPRTRSLLAGLAGVTEATVQELAKASLPLVVESSRSLAAAQERARELSAESGLTLYSTNASGLPAWASLVGFGALSIVPLLLAPLAGLLGWWFLVVPLLLMVTASVATGTALALSAQQRRGLHEAATRAWALQTVEPSVGVLDPARTELAAVRLQVAQADLPIAAETDLRSVLAELEAQLDGLSRRERTIDETRARVDVPGLRTRLSALDRSDHLDSSQRAERERLMRTLADVDAVMEGRTEIASEARRIRDTLTDLTSVLAQLGDDPSDVLLGRLAQAADRDRLRRAHAARQTEPRG